MGDSDSDRVTAAQGFTRRRLGSLLRILLHHNVLADLLSMGLALPRQGGDAPNGNRETGCDLCLMRPAVTKVSKLLQDGVDGCI